MRGGVVRTAASQNQQMSLLVSIVPLGHPVANVGSRCHIVGSPWASRRSHNHPTRSILRAAVNGSRGAEPEAADFEMSFRWAPKAAVPLTTISTAQSYSGRTTQDALAALQRVHKIASAKLAALTDKLSETDPVLGGDHLGRFFANHDRRRI